MADGRTRWLQELCARTVPAPARHARLLEYRDSALASTHPIGGKPCSLVGRQTPGSDVLIGHASVSRRHAALVHHRDGGVLIVDLGSVHGTWVGTGRLQEGSPRELCEGQVLRFGSSPQQYVFTLSERGPGSTADQPVTAVSLEGLMGDYDSDEDGGGETAGNEIADGTGHDEQEEEIAFGWDQLRTESREPKRAMTRTVEPAASPATKRRKRVSFALGSELTQVHHIESVVSILQRVSGSYAGGNGVECAEGEALSRPERSSGEREGDALRHVAPVEPSPEPISEKVEAADVAGHQEVPDTLPEMEWFCDKCDASISGVRYECRICPDEFCLCPRCFASCDHEHPLVANSASFHCSHHIPTFN